MCTLHIVAPEIIFIVIISILLDRTRGHFDPGQHEASAGTASSAFKRSSLVEHLHHCDGLCYERRLVINIHLGAG